MSYTSFSCISILQLSFGFLLQVFTVTEESSINQGIFLLPYQYWDQLSICLFLVNEAKPGSISRHQNMIFPTPNLVSGTFLAQINNTETIQKLAWTMDFSH